MACGCQDPASLPSSSSCMGCPPRLVPPDRCAGVALGGALSMSLKCGASTRHVGAPDGEVAAGECGELLQRRRDLWPSSTHARAIKR
ncbi:hypothetical protein ACP70R_008838 [Stipagrostis hirtigluma subsp. patula]